MNTKFRAWDKDSKWMDEVGDISWACDGTISYINGCLADDFILMQSTGLPDKNGKEIYDGDIVEVLYRDYENEKSIIEWDKRKCRFVLIDEDKNRYSFDETLSAMAVVIGNIHEVTK